MATYTDYILGILDVTCTIYVFTAS